MNKALLIFGVIITALISGCSTVDKKERLTGIVDACYTAYEYNQINDIEPYLVNRVKDGEISEDTKFVILKCLERGNQKK